jgi:hypothetical protein
LQPYRARWHEELEQRGRENLAAIVAAQKES